MDDVLLEVNDAIDGLYDIQSQHILTPSFSTRERKQSLISTYLHLSM